MDFFKKQEKILLVHGRGFNWKNDHFRIVYLPRVDELAQIQEEDDSFLKAISKMMKQAERLLFFIAEDKGVINLN